MKANKIKNMQRKPVETRHALSPIRRHTLSPRHTFSLRHTLSLILLTIFLTSCTWISGETVNFTIKLNPERMPTKDFQQLEWDNGKVIVHETGREPRDVPFNRSNLINYEINVSITVPVGSVIDIEVEVYQHFEEYGNVLAYFGEMKDGPLTVTSGSHDVNIQLEHSIRLQLDLDGGDGREFLNRVPGTWWSNSNVREELISLNVKRGETFGKYLEGNDPVRTDYTFVQWLYADESPLNFNDVIDTDDDFIYLLAKWELTNGSQITIDIFPDEFEGNLEDVELPNDDELIISLKDDLKITELTMWGLPFNLCVVNEDNNSITIYGRDFIVGMTYMLDIAAEKNGVYYSGSITFTITN